MIQSVIAQQLETAAFHTFAIGLGPQAQNQSVMLLLNPSGNGFETRRSFLDREASLDIKVYNEIPPYKDRDYFNGSGSSPLDLGWGLAQEYGENPTRLMLGVFFSADPKNIVGAFGRARETYRGYRKVRVELDPITLSSVHAYYISTALFNDIKLSWSKKTSQGNDPLNPSRVYVPFTHWKMYDQAFRALGAVFGQERAKEYNIY